MGVARGASEKHLVVEAVASLCVLAAVAVDGRGSAFVRLRIAGLVDICGRMVCLAGVVEMFVDG